MPASFTGSARGTRTGTGPFALPLWPMAASTAAVSKPGAPGAAAAAGGPSASCSARPLVQRRRELYRLAMPDTCMYIVPGSERRR